MQQLQLAEQRRCWPLETVPITEAAAGAFLEHLKNGPVIAAINAWHKAALEGRHKRESSARMEKAAGALIAHLRNGPLIAKIGRASCRERV